MSKGLNDLALRRVALNLTAQLPANPYHAARVVQIMQSLLPFLAGDVDKPGPLPLGHVE